MYGEALAKKCPPAQQMPGEVVKFGVCVYSHQLCGSFLIFWFDGHPSFCLLLTLIQSHSSPLGLDGLLDLLLSWIHSVLWSFRKKKEK